MSAIIRPSCLLSLQSENTCYHGHMVSKSKKIERPGGLKNVGHWLSSSSCQMIKAEQRDVNLYPFSLALFSSDITLQVVYEETENLV